MKSTVVFNAEENVRLVLLAEIGLLQHLVGKLMDLRSESSSALDHRADGVRLGQLLTSGNEGRPLFRKDFIANTGSAMGPLAVDADAGGIPQFLQ